ncbi:TIGR02302 family protein [Litoreibacter arenae]|uniref:Methyl-accepting chemotaxis protein n=1 Tax=Litoreibacter arenae DSM 19593 TaxID=1123360 RepID=S9QBI6_9RHOB|nr:TIGR02302 family protein [Litoreibacter arenae]EPX76983.1 Methyl-accepting chemotaxis protein [Litoreibacter arenae DSM 19593]
MSKPDTDIDLSALKWPTRLTLLGLWAERITHAFWPLWAVMFAAMAAWILIGLASLPVEVIWAAILVACGGLVASLVYAWRKFRVPSWEDALNRIDRTMPGRPVTAALDTQALGGSDAASQAVWRVHKERMQARLAEAEAVSPDLRVSSQDPYALRYVAVLLVVMTVGFGSLWRSGSLNDLAPGGMGQAVAAGPAWEIWIEPPAYTGKPSLYLNAVKVSELTVPKGSDLTVRLYGQVGSLTLSETVSGTVEPEGDTPQTAFSRVIERDGTIRIEGDDIAEWQITAQSDTPPEVKVSAEVSRQINGEMELPFTASDDYGVERGLATLALDLASVDRRYGLTVAPEPRDEIVLDLPMPISGGREQFTETLIENLSQHPWAGLPVTIDLSVADASDQTSTPEIVQAELPGRRFFQPIAKALVEQRRDLLWSRENAPRIVQILRTITYDPDGYFPSELAYLTTRMALTRLELAMQFGISDEKQDDIADMLWRAATLLEDGRLSDALERLQRAQDRLSDAMKEGATSEEIAELMQELSEAMQDYMEQLAQEGQDGEQQQAQGETQEITGDQLQEMLDEIQRLMEEGKMAEAQALLDQLMEMMKNMQVAQGEGGQGQQSPGQQAMEGLQETLRDQQGLSDEAFRDLQEQFNPGAQAGESEGNEGRNGGQGRGQSHDGQGGQQGEQEGQQGEGNQQAEGQRDGGSERSLADRQQALREELNRQQRNLPGQGTPEGDAAREALDRAGEAMDRAEEALRNDQTADALGAQSDAMEALREGMRNLGEAMAQQQRENQGQQGQNQGQASRQNRDPLGREQGTNGMIGSEDNMLQGENAQRRSRELLDEIRRRSGEQDRPEIERDYLKRLLDQF